MNFKVAEARNHLAKIVHLGLRSTVACNAASLYLIQFANYIVPLIMVPYLVQVLGPAGYGAVAFAQGFINYLMLFVEYGFNWSATRKISVLREDHQAVNRTALHVWVAKGLLSFAGFAVLLLLIAVVSKLKEVAWLLLALYGLVLGNVLFPTWLFQGMERMVAISAINLAMKVAVLVGVSALVHRPEDAVLYAALMGGGFFAAGLVGAIVAVRMFNLKFAPITWSEIWEALREGWLLFLSSASAKLYITGNAFVLGMLSDYSVVGFYAAAEKAVTAIRGILVPISSAAYPRSSKLASISKDYALSWAKRLLFLMVAIGAILTVITLIMAPLMIDLLFGKEYHRSTQVLRILALCIFIDSIVNVWGMHVMLPFNYDKAFFLVHIFAAIVNISLAIVLVPILQEVGMAISVLLSWLSMIGTESLFLWFKAGITPWLNKMRSSST